MACENYSTNGLPVGIGYDSNNKPKSLVELSEISVTGVTATNASITNATLNQVNPVIPGGTVTFNGAIAAESFIGLGGTGANAFHELNDVVPGQDIYNLVSNSDNVQVVVVDTTTSTVSAVDASNSLFSNYFQVHDVFLDVLATLTASPNTIIKVVDGGATLIPIGTIGQSLVGDETAADARTTLGLGSLATLNEISNINDIGNVTITTPDDGQVLTYVTGTGQWVNSTNPAGVTTIVALTDVANNLFTAASSYVLVVNASSNEVISVPVTGSPFSIYATTASLGSLAYLNDINSFSVSDLGDVSLTSDPYPNQVLTFQSGEWQNAFASLSGFLSDVSITGTPTTNHVLTWVGTRWEPQAVAGGPGSTTIVDLSDVDDNIFTNDGQLLVTYITGGLSGVSAASTTDFGLGLLDKANATAVTTYLNIPSTYATIASLQANADDHLQYYPLNNSRHPATLTVSGGNLNVSGDINTTGNVDGVDIAAFKTTTDNHIGSASVHYASTVVTAWVTAQDYATETWASSNLIGNSSGTTNQIFRKTADGWTTVSPYFSTLLLDVYLQDANAPTNGQVLVFNDTGWYASTLPTGGPGATALSSLTDAQIESPTTSATLIWNTGISRWVNGPALSSYVLSSTNFNLSSLTTSIQTSTVALSGYIAANENLWSSGTSLSTLGDVSITTPGGGQILWWVAGNNRWEAGPEITDYATTSDLSLYVLSSTNFNLSSLVNTHIADVSSHSNKISKSITLIFPSSTENITMFRAEQPFQLSAITFVASGTSPSANWSFSAGTDRSAPSKLLATGNTAFSTTTGSVITSFTDSSILANEFVIFRLNGTSGTIGELHATLYLLIST